METLENWMVQLSWVDPLMALFASILFLGGKWPVIVGDECYWQSLLSLQTYVQF